MTEGYHNDSIGLYYNVTTKGASWCYRFRWGGKLKEMGLGSARAFSHVDQVRDERDRWQTVLLREKKNPIEERRQIEDSAKRAQADAKAAKDQEQARERHTFGYCAKAYIASQESGWKNEKHRQQWNNTLETYCAPFWGKPVSEIDTTDVMGALSPIWMTKPETSSRLRGRIEKVLAFAKVKGYRTGDNPARWQEHLDHLLPMRKRKLTRGHHKAKPHAMVKGIIAELRGTDSIPARALEMTVLSAKRTTEIREMCFNEIDHERKVWVIPPDRMKANEEHEEPLTDRQLAIIAEMELLKTEADLREPNGGYVFKGRTKKGELTRRPLSNGAMHMLLRRLGHDDATVHGFRSSFRDWAGDETNFNRDLAEMALAHKVAKGTEAAYWRARMLEKRRGMMEAWGRYCEPKQPGKVVSINRKGAS